MTMAAKTNTISRADPFSALLARTVLPAAEVAFLLVIVDSAVVPDLVRYSAARTRRESTAACPSQAPSQD